MRFGAKPTLLTGLVLIVGGLVLWRLVPPRFPRGGSFLDRGRKQRDANPSRARSLIVGRLRRVRRADLTGCHEVGDRERWFRA